LLPPHESNLVPIDFQRKPSFTKIDIAVEKMLLSLRLKPPIATLGPWLDAPK
jgi:hypothetical protein